MITSLAAKTPNSFDINATQSNYKKNQKFVNLNCTTEPNKGPFLYYVRVKGWVGGITKYLLFLTGVCGWFWITLT